MEQEMQTARYIQRSLLPKEVPALPGWQLAPFYQPAREVGGDFYDVLPLSEGRLGLVIGDVSGKGVPAALVMASACTMLRVAAQEHSAPGEVLARVNDLLHSSIPASMFVTCFYGILDPHSGCMRYANAGHDWPYRRTADGIAELKASSQLFFNLSPPGFILRMVRVGHVWRQHVIVAPELLLEMGDQVATAIGMPLIAGTVNEEDVSCHRIYSFFSSDYLCVRERADSMP
jgi:hypothetical protein